MLPDSVCKLTSALDPFISALESVLPVRERVKTDGDKVLVNLRGLQINRLLKLHPHYLFIGINNLALYPGEHVERQRRFFYGNHSLMDI